MVENCDERQQRKVRQPKLPLSPGGSGSPPITWFLGPARVDNPNGTWIGSSVFVGLPMTARPASPRHITTAKIIERLIDWATFYYRYLRYLIVILIIIGIPSPTHSFTLGLNPSFSANPPYCSLSFFSFRFHYMDFPDCLLLLLSISVFLLFLFLHFF